MKTGRVGVAGACAMLLTLACASAVQDGGQTTNQEASGADVPALSAGSETADAGTQGASLFRDPQSVSDESLADASCAQCHGDDGSGSPRAPGIRDADADSLQDSAQGDVSHLALAGGRPGRIPEVKFPELTSEDFAALAAFLADG